MQYITQCPHYSRLITRRFRKGQLPSFQIVKEQCNFQRSSLIPATNQQRGLNAAAIDRNGGAERDRTDDLLLAKQALSQLSYSPGALFLKPLNWDTVGKLSWENLLVGLDGFEPSTPALSRRCSNQLSYRPLSGNRGWNPGQVSRQPAMSRRVR